MADIQRGKIIRGDIALWDGSTKTASRPDATGGTITGLTLGDYVDVLQIFGGGTARTLSTVSDAINRLSGANVTLLFSTGTWAITDNLTIPSNFVCHIAAGCIFDITSAKTLAFSGITLRESETWLSGSGTATQADDLWRRYTGVDLGSIPATINIGQQITHSDGVFEYRFEALSSFTPDATSIINDINAGNWRVNKSERILNGKFSYPVGWAGPTPDIYWTDDGRWLHVYDDEKAFRENYMVQADDALASGTETYFVNKAGNDGNGGLSEGDALLTITAAQLKADVYTIMVKGGDSAFYEITAIAAQSINIIGYSEDGADPPFIFKVPQANTFGAHVSAANVFELNVSFDLDAPMNNHIRDRNGLPTAYTEVDTLAEVSDKPNSYWMETSKICQIHGSAAPAIGTDIWISYEGWGSIVTDNTIDLNGVTIYLENLIWPNAMRCLGGLAAGVGIPDIRLLNVRGIGGEANDPMLFGEGNYILNRCIGAYSAGDGISVTGTNDGSFIEINCMTYECGHGGGSTQGSTMHESVNCLRIGGVYDSAGQNSILDVDTGKTINLGIKCGSGAVTDSIQTSGTREMWCFDCHPSGVDGGDHYDNGGTSDMWVSGKLAGIKIGGAGDIKLFGET